MWASRARGKSALLQSGLVPAWAKSQTSDFLPIYLDVWGEDWEKGPRQSLCDCVWKALSARDREILTACDLRLLAAVPEVSDIPSAGKSLIIVAVVGHVLHFRIFNGDGELVADTNEKGLAEQTPQIEGLRKLLESLWPPHELSKSEKDQVITAVASIVGRTIHTVKEAPRPEDLVAFLGLSTSRSAALRSSCSISSTTINRGTGPCSFPQTGRPGSPRRTWSRRTPSGATCKHCSATGLSAA